MKDIDITRENIMDKIENISLKLGVDNKSLVKYGDYMAKVNISNLNKLGKLVLVTAINPTPFGEGKTTVSIGLADGLRQINEESVAVLREPSLGPVFGMKGGATGGGYSQVVPANEINLHFTGDFHAISSANNLLCAAVDNHIFQGNELDINTKVIKRCLDVNDRFLRDKDFVITAASEVMSVFTLSTDLGDLRRRLGNIIVGYNSSNKKICAKDLGVVGSMVVLLKDSFMPNLVQTLEKTPVLLHGGPFANIAHGCNSIVATKMGLGLSDYVITEAGFGADLGAFKFLDIKCRKMGIYPDCVVLVATIKALKYNGDNLLENGLCNLEKHISNMKLMNCNLVVCLNKYSDDTEEEINVVKELCLKLDVQFSISTAYVDGGMGAIDLANKVVNMCEVSSSINLLYNEEDRLEDKIEIVSSKIFGAKEVNYSDKALSMINLIRQNNLENMPICISKTPYSFSDNPKLLGAPKDFDILVSDISVNSGGEFITVYLGGVITMPGLSKKPNYLNIDYINNEIVGVE